MHTKYTSTEVSVPGSPQTTKEQKKHPVPVVGSQEDLNKKKKKTHTQSQFLHKTVPSNKHSSNRYEKPL